MIKNTISNRLSALRAEMHKLNIDAWYISGTDPHSSEYLPARWQTRMFISGFTGSYGMVVVTKDEAALWTDSRYFLQAAEQLEGTGIQMMKLRIPDAVSPEMWLGKKLKAGSRVGMDAQTVSVAGFKSFENTLAKYEIETVETPDLLDNIWSDRPLDSAEKVFELGLEYSGVSRKEKQENIAADLQKSGADYQVVSMLDELAWLYNLRGNDISYNPVFNGFACIGKNDSYLFVESLKIEAGLKSILEKDGVTLLPYAQFYDFLSGVSGKKILVDPATLNYAAYSALIQNNELIESTSLVSLLKSRKNETEIAGFKEAMKKDGVALVEFHYWLKNHIGKETISEYNIGVKLKEFRAKQADFKGESFPPIVGYKSHGAMVHLIVGPDDAFPVEADGILLFDSGGQYLQGTTDITRTVALGAVSEQQRTDFTIVLKGMIGLTNAVFPFGTKGCHLDILARKPMWENGMNYGHGTGHGVGHFLNVHEGPMAIRQEYNENRIEPGNVMSNEPAFYREGLYGIRTENMIVCVEKEVTEFGRFLGFETLTLCPIDTTLIRVELLTTEEKDWMNNYHKKVNEALKPLLSDNLHLFLDQLTAEI
ncbi:aminopeptidase P family N-terminal domain-containing protein [uncultured Draconibacterium sp.]|uniref:aminopeptidase P family N-terminal domain-containing protein n=1 Tax=uncultured Draconibacterium sp. TaxID=1573823 RepID=UPI0032163A33